MTPLPSPACGSLPCSPKKNLNQGSLLRGSFLTALLVLMLTTAAEAFLAASRKLPKGALPKEAVGASITATVAGPTGRLTSQSGLSTTTTKYAASSTVTVWENNSQKRFIRNNGCGHFNKWVIRERMLERVQIVGAEHSKIVLAGLKKRYHYVAGRIENEKTHCYYPWRPGWYRSRNHRQGVFACARVDQRLLCGGRCGDLATGGSGGQRRENPAAGGVDRGTGRGAQYATALPARVASWCYCRAASVWLPERQRWQVGGRVRG